MDIYKSEFKAKSVELKQSLEEKNHLAGELTKANEQIDIANQELSKANKIIEDEAASIAEWKMKVSTSQPRGRSSARLSKRGSRPRSCSGSRAASHCPCPCCFVSCHLGTVRVSREDDRRAHQ